MRVNIYSQELTSETELVEQVSNTGVKYYAVRLYLHSSDRLHHPPLDDDRSAITLWLPKSYRRRISLANALARLAVMVEQAPPGGSD